MSASSKHRGWKIIFSALFCSPPHALKSKEEVEHFADHATQGDLELNGRSFLVIFLHTPVVSLTFDEVLPAIGGGWNVFHLRKPFLWWQKRKRHAYACQNISNHSPLNNNNNKSNIILKKPNMADNCWMFAETPHYCVRDRFYFRLRYVALHVLLTLLLFAFSENTYWC